MTTRVPLYFNPGDDEDRIFLYLDSTGAVVNITGYTAAFHGAVGEAAVTVIGSVSGSTGQVEVLVDHTATTTLGAEGWRGFYEVVITSGSGEITTIAEGPLILLPKE